MTRSSPWLAAASVLVILLGLAAIGPAPAGFWAPEGFVAQADKSYTLLDRSTGKTRKLSGKQLQEGIEVQLQAGRELRLTVTAEK